MKDYLFAFRGGMDFKTATEEETQASRAKWKTWMDSLSQQGKLIGGRRLTDTGKTVKGKKKEVSDGPYAESKEILGGYIVIRAKDLAEALEISKGCPILDYDGSLELRELMPPDLITSNKD